MQIPTARRRAENAAFLAALARTGNARLAARDLAVHRGTYLKRRARDPAFAAAWDQALESAQQILPGTGRGPACNAVEGATSPMPGAPPLILTPLATGRVQLRRARPGTITAAAEAAFLTALAASANVRLAAAAAGFAHSSFYARARRNRAFAREMRAALAQAYMRLQAELLRVGLGAGDGAGHGWRDNDPPPIPPMTAAQALQLLYLHQKTVELGWSQPHRRKRRGETDETYRLRLATMWAAERRMRREEEQACRLLQDPPLRSQGRGTSRRLVEGLPEGRGDSSQLILPALDQVTGWSKARPERVEAAKGTQHNSCPERCRRADLALFGGWRLKDWRTPPQVEERDVTGSHPE
jgi:hypothetical protein